MPAHLVVPLDGGSPFLHVQAFHDGIHPEAQVEEALWTACTETSDETWQVFLAACPIDLFPERLAGKELSREKEMD